MCSLILYLFKCHHCHFRNHTIVVSVQYKSYSLPQAPRFNPNIIQHLCLLLEAFLFIIWLVNDAKL